MKKIIVTTTIQSPTIATQKFAAMDDWELIVVGDDSTPHEEYEDLGCTYLRPDYQAKTYPQLSEILGWRTIQRRNIGFIEAYKRGADVVATVDDDNIPYDDWGQNLLVGQTVSVDCYHTDQAVFDPLSVTEHNHLWHRGFPIELLKDRNNVTYLGKVSRRVLVQADLWDGDPDIDAMARLTFSNPIVKFDITDPYCSDKIAPFNSQNTFLAREILPTYMVLPFVGRMDDIWGSYLMQMYFPNSVIFNKASVYQDRNEQDLITNLEHQILGYRQTLECATDPGNHYRRWPSKTKEFFQAYTGSFK